MGENEYSLVIGLITTTFGRKGEVKVRPDTDFPERFDDLKEVYVAGDNIPGRLVRIEKVWHHKGAVIVKFEGVDDMNAAETYRGAEVRVPETMIAPLGEDEYYIHDLIGMDVVTTEGEDLGKLKEVLRSPANDVYITDRAMIPAVKEFVVSIDLEAKKMVVKAVEGLVQE